MPGGRDRFSEHAKELAAKDSLRKLQTSARREREPAIVRARQTQNLGVALSSGDPEDGSAQSNTGIEEGSNLHTFLGDRFLGRLLLAEMPSPKAPDVDVKSEPAAGASRPGVLETVLTKDVQVSVVDSQTVGNFVTHEQLLETIRMLIARPGTSSAPRSGLINVPRMPMPTYSGGKDENLRNFLRRLGDWMRLTNCIDDRDKLAYLTQALRGPAETWYHSVRDTADWQTWDSFVADFEKQWSHQIASTHQLVHRLTTYTQSGSVDSWHQCIVSLSLALQAQHAYDHINPTVEVHHFIRGLNPEIRQHLRTVELLVPEGTPTLDEALRHAREKELTTRSGGKPRGQFSGSRRGGHQRHAAPEGSAENPIVLNQLRKQGSGESRKARLRREGKCFTCEKPGHLAQVCPDKKALK